MKRFDASERKKEKKYDTIHISAWDAPHRMDTVKCTVTIERTFISSSSNGSEYTWPLSTYIYTHIWSQRANDLTETNGSRDDDYEVYEYKKQCNGDRLESSIRLSVASIHWRRRVRKQRCNETSKAWKQRVLYIKATDEYYMNMKWNEIQFFCFWLQLRWNKIK